MALKCSITSSDGDVSKKRKTIDVNLQVHSDLHGKITLECIIGMELCCKSKTLCILKDQVLSDYYLI